MTYKDYKEKWKELSNKEKTEALINIIGIIYTFIAGIIIGICIQVNIISLLFFILIATFATLYIILRILYRKIDKIKENEAYNKELEDFQKNCSHLWIPMKDFEYCHICGKVRK